MGKTVKTSKISTIIKHEYMTRFRSKGFIISTILAPVMIIVLIGVIVLINVLMQDSGGKKIAILDMTGRIGEKILQLDTSKYYLTTESEASLREKVLKEQLDAYLLIPKDFIENGDADVYSRGGGGLGFIINLDSDMSKILRHERLLDAGADIKVIELAEKGANIRTQKITEKGAETDFAGIYAVLGYILGIMIYMMTLIYGATVMRGVIEEKTNRIVEVIASSARPFEIMMGKVVGIGLLGLTQITIWGALALTLFFFKGSLISLAAPQAQMMSAPGMASDPNELLAIMNMPAPSPWLIIAFFFYFLSGYFVYSTLFAAIGSAVDQESDAQQLQLPVTLPIIIPMLFIYNVMANPDGLISIILSLIPFFAPILMMVRITATEVPLWQIAASVTLMIATFIGAIWVAARIYRIGILMYGKKPGFRELFKWIRLAK